MLQYCNVILHQNAVFPWQKYSTKYSRNTIYYVNFSYFNKNVIAVYYREFTTIISLVYCRSTEIFFIVCTLVITLQFCLSKCTCSLVQGM